MTNNEFDKYQAWVKNAWFASGSKEFSKRDIMIMGFGLAGETGEVMEYLKKLERDGKEDREHLKKELGDVLYYLAMIGETFGIPLSEVVAGNQEKLNGRIERGTLQGSGNDR